MTHQQKRTARAVIFHPDGKILLLERHKGDKHYFVLPGGHIEDLESPEWAVAREVHEETGLEVTVVKLLYTSVDAFGQHQNIYLCKYNEGEPSLPPDSIEARLARETGDIWRPNWFTPEQLLGQIIYPLGIMEMLEVDIEDDFTNNPKELVEQKV